MATKKKHTRFPRKLLDEWKASLDGPLPFLSPEHMLLNSLLTAGGYRHTGGSPSIWGGTSGDGGYRSSLKSKYGVVCTASDEDLELLISLILNAVSALLRNDEEYWSRVRRSELCFVPGGGVNPERASRQLALAAVSIHGYEFQTGAMGAVFHCLNKLRLIDSAFCRLEAATVRAEFQKAQTLDKQAKGGRGHVRWRSILVRLAHSVGAMGLQLSADEKVVRKTVNAWKTSWKSAR